jgi:hypothetical protein
MESLHKTKIGKSLKIISNIMIISIFKVMGIGVFVRMAKQARAVGRASSRNPAATESRLGPCVQWAAAQTRAHACRWRTQ